MRSPIGGAADRGGTLHAADRAGNILSGEEVSAADGLPTEEVPQQVGAAANSSSLFTQFQGAPEETSRATMHSPGAQRR